jgi:hypothetical protein
VRRGELPSDPAPIKIEEVAGWFGQRRGSKPAPKKCANLAEFLNRGPSAEWLALQERDNDDNNEPNDGQHFKIAAKALEALTGALPKVSQHWNDVIDCETAFAARRALADLDVAIVHSANAIKYPFGAYRKSTGHKPQVWQSTSIIIFKQVCEALSEAKEGRVSYSENSVAVRVTSLALERLGYGVHQTGKIANFLSRWMECYRSGST